MIKIINKTINKEEIIYDRQEIENRLIQQNLYYFKKVHNTRVYYNKVYHKITQDEIRNKILNGSLKAEDYDNNNIFKFLSLLKQV